MRVVKNVLYLLHDNMHLSCENENFVITKFSDDGIAQKQYIPVVNVELVVVFGHINLATSVVQFCNEFCVVLSFVSVYGNYYGRISGKTKGNIRVRKSQYDLYDNYDFRMGIVRNMILGKLINSRETLLYVANHMDVDVSKVVSFLDINMKFLQDADSVERVREIEAVCATSYYSVFDDLLKGVSDDMKFVRRTRRPPENNFNAILSYLYTMCHLNCVAALESFGLDSYFGYMHAIRPGRESLASDLIEEFRAPFVDRFVIALVNRKQVVSSDFVSDQGGIWLTDDARKKVLQLWENEKLTQVWYPLLKKKVERRLVPYLQAQYLADCIRGRISEYPSWIWDWRK